MRKNRGTKNTQPLTFTLEVSLSEIDCCRHCGSERRTYRTQLTFDPVEKTVRLGTLADSYGDRPSSLYVEIPEMAEKERVQYRRLQRRLRKARHRQERRRNQEYRYVPDAWGTGGIKVSGTE